MDSNFHPPNELDQETAYLTPDGEFLREHLKAQYLIIFANSIDCSVQFVEIAYWVMRQPGFFFLFLSPFLSCPFNA